MECFLIFFFFFCSNWNLMCCSNTVRFKAIWWVWYLITLLMLDGLCLRLYLFVYARIYWLSVAEHETHVKLAVWIREVHICEYDYLPGMYSHWNDWLRYWWICLYWYRKVPHPTAESFRFLTDWLQTIWCSFLLWPLLLIEYLELFRPLVWNIKPFLKVLERFLSWMLHGIRLSAF